MTHAIQTRVFPLLIGGSTGSGKSSLALSLARKLKELGLRPEILCADSITVYSGFDLGSTKPTRSEREEFPHHLIDICRPTDSFTAGDFLVASRAALTAIQARGGFPIITGGSGFYFRALLSGMVTEEEDKEEALVRKRFWENEAQKLGWDALYDVCIQRDPGLIQSVHKNDHYRIIRSLQAMDLHGQGWSSRNREKRALGFKEYPQYRYYCLRWDRSQLIERIKLRTQALLAMGFVNEVRSLLQSGVPAHCKPMQSVGYKECVDFLENRIQQSELEERIFRNTCRLAKQQSTWFRGEQGIRWIDPPFTETILSDLLEANPGDQ